MVYFTAKAYDPNLVNYYASSMQGNAVEVRRKTSIIIEDNDSNLISNLASKEMKINKLESSSFQAQPY